MQASLNPVADAISKLVATAIKYQEVSVPPPDSLGSCLCKGEPGVALRAV